MLVLTRKINESFRIGESIDVTVIDIRAGTVRLGIDAPREVPIVRHELLPDNPAGLPTTNTGEKAMATATATRSAANINALDTPKPISQVEVNEARSDAEAAATGLRRMVCHIDGIGLKLNDVMHILDGSNDEEAPAGSDAVDVWESRRKWVRELVEETRKDKERVAQLRAEALNAATDAINTLSGLGRFALAVVTLRFDNADDLQAFREARPILAAMNVGGGSTESDIAAMCRRLLTESAPVDPTASATIDTAEQDAA